jgi:hypothetical protein
VSVPGSCTLLTADVTVTEKPLPDPVITFNGSMLRTGTFYTSWQWYKNLVPISGATAYQTVYSGGGNYKVRVTDTNGCQSISDAYVIAGGGSTSVAGTEDASDIKIYPNPAQHAIFIDEPHEINAVLRSIDGRELIRINHNEQMNISNLANGIYILSVYSNENLLLTTEKVIKQ